MASHGMEWALEALLIVLLASTLVHALRLERALGVLRRDRAQLETLIAGFNEATQQAETGVERLRAAADGAGRQIARQVDAANALRDDLSFLTERGERLADQLERAVRTSRVPAYEASRPEPPRVVVPEEPSRIRSQAERDLMQALRVAR